MEIILWFAVITTWGIESKGLSIGKVENHGRKMFAAQRKEVWSLESSENQPWWIFLFVNLTISAMNYNLEMEGTAVIWLLRQEDNMSLIQILRFYDTRHWSSFWGRKIYTAAIQNSLH